MSSEQASSHQTGWMVLFYNLHVSRHIRDPNIYAQALKKWVFHNIAPFTSKHQQHQWFPVLFQMAEQCHHNELSQLWFLGSSSCYLARKGWTALGKMSDKFYVVLLGLTKQHQLIDILKGFLVKFLKYGKERCWELTFSGARAPSETALFFCCWPQSHSCMS